VPRYSLAFIFAIIFHGFETKPGTGYRIGSGYRPSGLYTLKSSATDPISAVFSVRLAKILKGEPSEQLQCLVWFWLIKTIKPMKWTYPS
jgi:hypothetical protein